MDRADELGAGGRGGESEASEQVGVDDVARDATDTDVADALVERDFWRRARIKARPPDRALGGAVAVNREPVRCESSPGPAADAALVARASIGYHVNLVTQGGRFDFAGMARMKMHVRLPGVSCAADDATKPLSIGSLISDDGQ